MTNDIVNRLRRNSRNTSYRPVVDEMILEAADLIEAQAAQIEMLKDALDTAKNYLVERGIEYRGKVGRTEILPAIIKALSATELPK